MSESPDEQDELHGEGVATPLWVKAFALAALIIVTLFVCCSSRAATARVATLTGVGSTAPKGKPVLIS